MKTQEIGAAVADFSLPDVIGGDRSLKGAVEGRKGAVVLFWSGICSHCARYDDYFNSFTAQHPELGFLAVASRVGETSDLIRKTIAERSLTFPILWDAGSKLAAAWSTQQTPRAFLLDPSLTLLYRGAIDNFKYAGDPSFVPYLEPAIADFLAGRPVARADTPSFGCAIQSVYYVMPKLI